MHSVHGNLCLISLSFHFNRVIQEMTGWHFGTPCICSLQVLYHHTGLANDCLVQKHTTGERILMEGHVAPALVTPAAGESILKSHFYMMC